MARIAHGCLPYAPARPYYVPHKQDAACEDKGAHHQPPRSVVSADALVAGGKGSSGGAWSTVMELLRGLRSDHEAYLRRGESTSSSDLKRGGEKAAGHVSESSLRQQEDSGMPLMGASSRDAVKHRSILPGCSEAPQSRTICRKFSHLAHFSG